MNTRVRALAEIYLIHSFAPLLESEVEKSVGKRTLAQKALRKDEKKKRVSSNSLRSSFLERKRAAEKEQGE